MTLEQYKEKLEEMKDGAIFIELHRDWPKLIDAHIKAIEALGKAADLLLEPHSTGDAHEARLLCEETLSKITGGKT